MNSNILNWIIFLGAGQFNKMYYFQHHYLFNNIPSISICMNYFTKLYFNVSQSINYGFNFKN